MSDMHTKFAAFVTTFSSSIGKNGLCFESKRFIERWGSTLLALEGKSTGEAIDALVNEHGFYESEAKPVVVALRDSGTVKFSEVNHGYDLAKQEPR